MGARKTLKSKYDNSPFTVCWLCLDWGGYETYFSVNHGFILLIPMSEAPCSYCYSAEWGLSDA